MSSFNQTKTANNLDKNTLRLFNHIWRGGKYSYYSDENKLQTWFEVNKIPHPPTLEDVWFGVNPVDEIPKTNSSGEIKNHKYVRSRTEYISAINVLYAEFDAEDPDNLNDTLNHIKSLEYPPSVIVCSGGGYHCYWLLQQTVFLNNENRETVRKAQWDWVTYVQGESKRKRFSSDSTCTWFSKS